MPPRRLCCMHKHWRHWKYISREGTGSKAAGPLVCICKCADVCLHNGLGSSCVCDPSPKLLWLMMRVVVLHYRLRRISCRRQPWGGQMKSCGLPWKSFISEINPSARHKWEDNIIITPQASRLCFSIGLLSFLRDGSHMVRSLWLVCVVYVHARAPKIPLKGICIGLPCYSRLSGTLVLTYLSMSVQAAENKLICFSFYSLLFLCLFFPLCHSASITVPHIAFFPFPPSSHCYASARLARFLLSTLFICSIPHRIFFYLIFSCN